MKPKIWIPSALAVLLVIGGITWALLPSDPPEVKQVREIANRMFDEETTDEQRRELRQQMREIGDTLPEDQRREVFREMGNQFRQRMKDHMREFAALPEDQRDDFLDRDIDRMEAMRREWEQRRAERERERNAAGERTGGDRGPRGGGPGSGPPERGGPGGGRQWTEEEREQRRRARLDNTTAEDRAYFMDYIQAINQRREERGLEPLRRGPFGRGPR